MARRALQTPKNIHSHIHKYSMYIYIQIYAYTHVYIYIYLYMYATPPLPPGPTHLLYIYIYICSHTPPMVHFSSLHIFYFCKSALHSCSFAIFHLFKSAPLLSITFPRACQTAINFLDESPVWTGFPTQISNQTRHSIWKVLPTLILS